MSVDLLKFVDSRVTISEHPANELIRNAIQLKFDESKDELKLHIGREGIHYRLVSSNYVILIDKFIKMKTEITDRSSISWKNDNEGCSLVTKF